MVNLIVLVTGRMVAGRIISHEDAVGHRRVHRAAKWVIGQPICTGGN